MGAGKSSIGRRLARALGLPFFDTDQTVQARTGVDIGFIFEKEGEAGFRRREESVLADLLDGDAAVIATGGGAILSAASRERIRQTAVVVFLETSVDWQLARTRRGSHRPLLDAADPREKLASLYDTREPLYRECATLTINTDGLRVAAVAATVLRELERIGFVQ